jgi:hypothetical protein
MGMKNAYSFVQNNVKRCDECVHERMSLRASKEIRWKCMDWMLLALLLMGTCDHDKGP